MAELSGCCDVSLPPQGRTRTFLPMEDCYHFTTLSPSPCDSRVVGGDAEWGGDTRCAVGTRAGDDALLIVMFNSYEVDIKGVSEHGRMCVPKRLAPLDQAEQKAIYSEMANFVSCRRCMPIWLMR